MKIVVAPAPKPTDAVAVAVAVASDAVGQPVDGRDGMPWPFLEAQGFTGEIGQCQAIPRDDGGQVLYVGIGPGAEVDAARLRSASAVATRAARTARTLTLDLGRAGEVDPAERIRAQAEGVILGAYRFDTYRSAPAKDRLRQVVLVGEGAGLKAAARDGARLAEATCVARDLVNEPGGTLTAPVFAERAATLAEANDVACTVHDEKAVRRLGLGGLLAVNRGSSVPPRFVELAWDPAKATRRTATVALVGKGITFDSGGLSLKTAEGMTTMKCDMAGAAAVLAAVTACRDLGIAVRVRGYLPLTDNMTGGDAQRVGDVITHYGGSTTEVLNTDAEGRLILADALAWATRERKGHAAPSAALDLATLTGAAMVGLGSRTAAVLANDEDLAARVIGAGARAGERLWRLPLVDAERKGLESKVADRKNIAGRYGGAITAALFLRDFVGADVPWAHLDIAGPAFNEGDDELEVPAGGTGFGARTLLALLGAWKA